VKDVKKGLKMHDKDRRLQPRVEVRWPVSLVTSDGAIAGETKDISMQGAYIYCDEPLPVSERFTLNVKAPAASMQVMAQVVWKNNSTSDKETERMGMGVRFIWS
jgi:hypothetical protein